MALGNLKIIRINSKFRGIVELNGSTVGETDGALSVYVPGSRFLLSFIPLENTETSVILPFSRIIDITTDRPEICADDGSISLFILPENQICAILKPPELLTGATELPYVLSSLDFRVGTLQYHSSVYFDRVMGVSIEYGSNIIYAGTLGKGITAAVQHVRMIGGHPYLLVEATQGDSKLVAALYMGEKNKRIQLLEECSRYSETENSIILFLDMPEGVTVSTEYMVEKGVLTKKRVQLKRYGELKNAARCLCFAVKYKNQEIVNECLSAGLRSALTFQDMADFFGDFSHDAPHLCHENQLALCYTITKNISTVRLFNVETDRGAISNISEVE